MKLLLSKPFIVISLLLVVVLSSLRFLWLDRFPVGMTHDELEYILSSRTYGLMGVDLSGVSFPSSIFKTNTEGIISFLPPLLLAPYYSLVPLNQFTARLPYVFISLLTVLVLYLFTRRLFGHRLLALITAIVFLINPWSYYLSRTAVDTPFALLFCLLGLYFTTATSRKSLIFALISFVLMFFSYHGAKPLVFPIFVVTLWYRLSHTHSRLTIPQAVILASSILILTIGYFAASRFIPGSVASTRSQDIIFLNNDTLASQVNEDRRLSLESPLKNFISNKITVSSELFFQKYLSAFSPDTLFVSGDSRATYRFGRHGLFFAIDLILIFIGLVALYLNHRSQAVYLTLLLLIAPLSTALSTVGTSVINRSFLLLPILVIFIAYGLWSVFTRSRLLFAGATLALLISFTNFLHFYYYRFSIIGQENYFLSQRLVANYLNRSNNTPSLILSSEPREVLLETIFYSPSSLTTSLPLLIKGNYQLNNMLFTATCPPSLTANQLVIADNSHINCPSLQSPQKAITEDQFGGPLYRIYNDSVCTGDTPKWARFHLVSDYLPETMSTADFCHTWIRSL